MLGKPDNMGIKILEMDEGCQWIVLISMMNHLDYRIINLTSSNFRYFDVLKLSQSLFLVLSSDFIFSTFIWEKKPTRIDFQPFIRQNSHSKEIIQN